MAENVMLYSTMSFFVIAIMISGVKMFKDYTKISKENKAKAAEHRLTKYTLDT